MIPQDYDKAQLQARLQTCPSCAHEYYMTHGRTICVRCKKPSRARDLSDAGRDRISAKSATIRLQA